MIKKKPQKTKQNPQKLVTHNLGQRAASPAQQAEKSDRLLQDTNHHFFAKN